MHLYEVVIPDLLGQLWGQRFAGVTGNYAGWVLLNPAARDARGTNGHWWHCQRRADKRAGSCAWRELGRGQWPSWGLRVLGGVGYGSRDVLQECGGWQLA
jgi:hypothetical protein